MRKLLLLLLLDAFRPDYLQRTDYIRHLAHQGAIGHLRETLGFAPRVGYFGGLWPEECGFSNMFWYDPINSPFQVARFLCGAGVQSSKEAARKAREKIAGIALKRVTPYVASYLSPLDIPLEYLHYFDAAEKRAPWDPKVGYRSLFAILEEQGYPWFQCSWPTSNLLPAKGDTAVLEYTLANLKPSHRFAYVHFGELDGIGHTYGPGSVEMQQALDRLDRHVQKLLEHCYDLYDVVDLIMFADHGMVNVVRALNVWESLQNTRLRFGNDFVCFLDSTMVRFWFSTRVAKRMIEEALSSLQGGRILDEEDLCRYRIAGCDKRNGELYFMADPGVLVFPNFFQMFAPVKGMHGYALDFEDNRGIFIINSQSRLCRGWLGVVDAPQVFHTCLDMLGLNVPELDHSCSALKRCGEVSDGSKYTLSASPGVDEVIADHLSQIVEAVNSAIPDVKAIILTGGFGRGEGGIINENGHIRPINDYDLLVVGTQIEQEWARLKELGKELAREIGIDFVDLGPVSSEYITQLALTMFTYDLKYGSQVLWGDPFVLDRLPRYASADISLEEGLILLFNRIAGLLLGLPSGVLPDLAIEGHDREVLINQVIKSLIAIGDWYLLTWQGYAASYATRHYRFAALGRAFGLSEQLRELVEMAYKFKLLPEYQAIADVKQLLFAELPLLKHTLVMALQTTGGYPCPENGAGNLPMVLKDWYVKASERWGNDIAALRAAMSLVLFSLEEPGRINNQYLVEAREWVSKLAKVPPMAEDGKDDLILYGLLRDIVVGCWEEKCH